MIIDRYRCIYTNIPKTGSQSVRQFLSSEQTHFPLFKERLVDSTKFEQYYKFAFVRNPWDRLVSIYAYLLRGGSNDYDKNSRKKYTDDGKMTFEEFILNLTPDNINEQVHLKPQFYWICEENSKMLLTDFLGYFENIDQDWQIIHSKLNLEERTDPIFNIIKSKMKNSFVYKKLYNNNFAKELVHRLNMSKSVNSLGVKTRKLPHVNKSDHSHYSKMYSQKTISHVKKLYNDDIQLFNYSFEQH